LKGKYLKVKEKCFKLNKENDFYNQAITVFLTIKKVLEKQIKFTQMFNRTTIKSMGSNEKDSILESDMRPSAKKNIFRPKTPSKDGSSGSSELDQRPEDIH